ncbi:GMC oxidoreductase [Rhizobium mongolense]
MSDVAIPKNANAKIVFYSRGKRDNAGQIIYPFNVEMNVNHEYWHLRENDPSSPDTPIATTGDSIIDIKFSFGNCLDSGNAIREAPPFGYVPYKEWFGGPILPESVVDEDLRVKSAANLYVCDMSVMPFASAANPVRTLTALALPSRLPALAGWQKSDTEVFAVLND